MRLLSIFELASLWSRDVEKTASKTFLDGYKGEPRRTGLIIDHCSLPVQNHPPPARSNTEVLFKNTVAWLFDF